MQERETYINKNGKLTLHSTSIGGRRAKKKKGHPNYNFSLGT
jgi:hypothetical protein